MKTVDDLLRLITDRGGVVRSVVVAESGFSRRTVETAQRRGLITRPRRGWLAAKGAEKTVVTAARLGVVLTCRTQAGSLCLWEHDHGGAPHFAVPHNAAVRIPFEARGHRGKPIVPRHPDALVDPIENVLAYIAECEPFERALATWESALNKSLVTLEALRGYAWKPAARKILDHAVPFSDAGLETYLRVRLRWLRVAIRVQIWIAGHRVDALIGERLVIQIDGAHHVGAQRSEDIRHDAELTLMGYHVMRVSYAQVMFDWPLVQDLIMRAVAQGLHRAACLGTRQVRVRFASPNMPRTDCGSAHGLRRCAPARTPEEAHSRDRAYNGCTSCDPDITGELSEERSVLEDGLSRTERGRPVTAAVRVAPP